MSWNGLRAILRYELLWNIRKKKLIGLVLIVLTVITLSNILPYVLFEQRPDPYSAVKSSAGPPGFQGGLFYFIFALILAMNMISTEFETGSIVPLFSKPISRNTILLGKILAALFILMGVYSFLNIYDTLLRTAIHGPQKDLYLLVPTYLGTLLSTFTWMSIIIALGAISRSTTVTVVGSILIYFGISITNGIVSFATDHSYVLSYIIGGGAPGYIQAPQSPLIGGAFAGPPPPIHGVVFVSSGSDAIPYNLLVYAYHPNAGVTFFRYEITGPGSLIPKTLFTDHIVTVLLRATFVAFAYLAVLLTIALLTFKRVEAIEKE